MLKRITAITLIALLFLLNAGSVHGLAVCVGENGHLEIEVTHNGKCIDSYASAHAPEGTSISKTADAHCGSCQDFPLFAETPFEEVLLPKLRLTALETVPRLVLSSASTLDSRENTLRMTRFYAQGLEPPHAPYLHATILLI